MIIDVIYAWFAEGIDRNLFPFEIVLSLGLLTLPTVAGYVGGRLVAWRYEVAREP